MKFQSVRKALFLLLTMLLVLALAPSLAESYNAGTMRLLRYEGSVEILDPEGAPRFVLENVRFASGESLRTGEDGMASVGLDESKIVTLDSSSQVEFIQEDNHIRLSLTEGALFLDVQESLDENEGLDIQTTTMTVGIRGTIVFVGDKPSPDGGPRLTSLGVLEGTAHVNYTDTSGGSRLLEVPAGVLVSIPEPQAEGAGVAPVVAPLRQEDIAGFVAETIKADPVLTDRVENGSDLGSSLLSGVPGDSSGSENPENSWAANGNWAWPGTVTLVAQSASKVYDGQPLMRPSGALVHGLPGDFSIEVTCAGSQTGAGRSANRVASWTITNAAGENVTSHFHSVETVDGTLVVEPAPLVVWTGSDEKVYDGEPLVCEDAEIRTVPGHTAEDPVWRNSSIVTRTALGSEKMIAVSGTTYVVGTNPLTGETRQFELRTGQTLTVCLHGEGERQTIEFKIETLAVEDLPEEVLRLYADNPELLAQACQDTGWDPAEVEERISGLSAAETPTVRQNGLNVSGDSRDSLMVDSANVRIHIDSQFTNYSTRALTGEEATFTPIALDPSIVITAAGEQTEVGESVNTYEIDWGNADAANFVLQEDLGTLAVKPLEVQVSVGGAGAVYNGYPFVLRPYVTYLNGTHAGETVQGVRLRGEGPADTVSDTPVNAGTQIFRFTLFTGDTLELSVSGGGTSAGIYDLAFKVTSSSEHIGSVGLSYAGTRIYIDPAELTIATGSASKPYDGKPLTSEEVTVTGLAGNDSITVKAAGTQTEVGESSNTYEIDWGSVNPKNYKVTEELGTLTVTEPETRAVTVTVTGNRASAAYTGEAQKAEGYTVSFSDPAYTEKDFTFSGAAAAEGTVPGTYPMGLKAEQFRNTNDKFDVTFQVTDGELTVTKGAVVLTAESFTAVYNGLSQGAFFGVSVEGAPEGVEVLADGEVYWKDADTYTLTPSLIMIRDRESGEDVSEYFTVRTVQGTLTVEPLQLSIDLGGKTVEYDGSIQVPSPAVTVGNGPRAGQAATLESSMFGEFTVRPVPDAEDAFNLHVSGAGMNAGEYTLSGSYEFTAGSADNYQISYTDNNQLVITAKPVTVTVTGKTASKTYNGAEQTLSGYDAVSSDPAYTADNFTFSGTAEIKKTNAGTYPMGLSADMFTNTNGNYAPAFTVTDGSLTISKAPLTVTTPGDSKKYDGGPLPTTTDLPIVSGLQGSDTVSIACNANQITDAGSADNRYTITWNGALEANYEIKTENLGTLTVSKRSVTLTSADAEKEYDGSALTKESVTAGGDGFAEGEGATYTFTGKQTEVGSSANTFTYTLNDNTKAGNYEITTEEGTLTVKAKTVTVTVTGNKVSKPYDASEQEAEGYTVSISDPLYKKTDFTFSGTAAVKGTVPGSYPMGLAADQFTNTNDRFIVTFAVTDGSLEITKGSLTVNAPTLEKDWDGEGLVSDGIITGLPDNDLLWAYAEASCAQSDAGTWDNVIVECVVGDRDENDVTEYFDIETVKGTVTIRPKPVTVTITGSSDTRTYDSNEHTVSGYSVSISDPAYKESDFTFSGTSEIKKTNAGTYQMGLGAGMFTNKNGNFSPTFTVTDGSLTITKAPLTVTTPTESKTYDGSPLPETTDQPSVIGLKGTDWVEPYCLPGQLTDADSAYNQYKIKWTGALEGNYEITSEILGTLTVNKRSVTLTSENADKIYDGTPLTKHSVSVGGDGFAYGEGASYSFTGSQTAAGSSENTFTYTLNDNTKAGNYNISQAFGTLTVGEPDTLTFDLHGTSFDFDAYAHYPPNITGTYGDGTAISGSVEEIYEMYGSFASGIKGTFTLRNGAVITITCMGYVDEGTYTYQIADILSGDTTGYIVQLTGNTIVIEDHAYGPGS